MSAVNYETTYIKAASYSLIYLFPQAYGVISVILSPAVPVVYLLFPTGSSD